MSDSEAKTPPQRLQPEFDTRHGKPDKIKDVDKLERITVDVGVLAGKPIVRGTRISVEMVIDLLAAGWTPSQVYENYPTLKPGDVEACLAYAGALLHEERVYPLKTA